MKFWDTSALVPALVAEASSGQVRAMLAPDPQVIVWWATGIECVSAIARRERAEADGPAKARDAYEILHRLSAAWYEVSPSDALRDDARRLVRVHDLRAADACQLAAARLACDASPSTLPFVTLDARLADAARREGFPVLGV